MLFSPQMCPLLKKFVVVESVGVLTVPVDNVLEVGVSLPVQPGDLLVPEPVGIVRNMRQCPVPTGLEGDRYTERNVSISPGGPL